MQLIPLDNKQITELIKQCRHLNIFPDELDYIFLKQDPLLIYEFLENLVESCREYLKIVSTEEIEALVESLPWIYRERIDYKSPWLAEHDLFEKISLYYVISQINRTYFSIKDLLDLQSPDSEVFKVYPELQKKFDDTGSCADRDVRAPSSTPGESTQCPVAN